MDQHIISAWYLRAFSRRVGRKPLLHVYDKAEDSIEQVSVDDFLAETDAHSAETERQIETLEGPASEAARRLVKRVKVLQPGMYALAELDAPTVSVGPSHFSAGHSGATELMVTRHQIASPSAPDMAALAAYAGLMYWRAPKVQVGIAEMRRTYDVAAQRVLDVLMPGMQTETLDGIDKRRLRAVKSASGVGARLAAANWWVIRAPVDEPFLLGDNPVGTTVSLGHDDSWRAILSNETFVVAMPLGPSTGLLIAPNRFLPFSGFTDPNEAAAAINRLTWRSADRFIVSQDRAQLENVAERLGSVRSARIPVDIDLGKVSQHAAGDSVRIVADVLWRRDFGRWAGWGGCRAMFGYFPFATEDRDSIYGPHRDDPPTPPV